MNNLLLAVTLAACSRGGSDERPTSLAPSSAQVTTSPPTRAITPAALPSATAAAPPNAICPSTGQSPELVFPTNIDELQSVIFNYLNGGGDPQRLSAKLEGLQASANSGITLHLTSVDISGDGVAEIVITAQMLLDRGEYHESAVWAFHCSAGVYEQPVRFAGGIYDWSPKILFVGDLNADNRPEVVIQLNWGGSGCFEEFLVLGCAQLRKRCRLFCGSHSRPRPGENRVAGDIG